MSVFGFALSWDRLIGALLGFMLAWVAYSVLNQVLWLPQAREAERSRLAADALQKTIEVIQSREKPMWKSLLVMPLLCVSISACKTTTSVNVCAGWQKLRPSLETAVHIATMDRQFANSVAAYNAHGSRQGCW